MTAENDLLHAIARQIRRGDRTGFERAGRVISQSMNDRRRTPWFRSKLEELAEIWLHGFEACADGLDPITCRQLPGMLRAVNPDWRRRPWGPSLSHVGRTLARAPMTNEEVAAFLDHLSTEDGFREWCVYGRLPCQNGLSVEPLISIDGDEIPGAPIARLYRQGKLDRWWHPRTVHSDHALIADYLILLTSQYAVDRERLYVRIAERLKPYLHRLESQAARQEASCTAQELASVGVIRGGIGESWRTTAAMGQQAAECLRTAWRRHSRRLR